MTGSIQGSGGCAHKLGRPELDILLAEVNRAPSASATHAVAEVRNRGDVSQVTLLKSSDSMLVSADLLYSICDDGETFGYITAIHAMSDIYAALGLPSFGCVTLSTGRADIESGTSKAILRGLITALQEHGAVLAGGHTVDTGDAFINLAVVGSDLGYNASEAMQPGDLILLSKPLGSGVALAGRKLGVLSDAELLPEYEQMRVGNDRPAGVLRRLIDEHPGGVRGVTDVSGFGLLDALSTITGPVALELYGNAVPVYPHAIELIAKQAWSALADSNLAHTSEFTVYDDDASRSFLPIILNDPQTSGGLLAILDPAAVASLRGYFKDAFTMIGKINSTATDFSVRVRRDALAQAR